MSFVVIEKQSRAATKKTLDESHARALKQISDEDQARNKTLDVLTAAMARAAKKAADEAQARRERRLMKKGI